MCLVGLAYWIRRRGRVRSDPALSQPPTPQPVSRNFLLTRMQPCFWNTLFLQDETRATCPLFLCTLLNLGLRVCLLGKEGSRGGQGPEIKFRDRETHLPSISCLGLYDGRSSLVRRHSVLISPGSRHSSRARSTSRC